MGKDEWEVRLRRSLRGCLFGRGYYKQVDPTGLLKWRVKCFSVAGRVRDYDPGLRMLRAMFERPWKFALPTQGVDLRS
jgi:hypothetical protein